MKQQKTKNINIGISFEVEKILVESLALVFTVKPISLANSSCRLMVLLASDDLSMTLSATHTFPCLIC